MQLFKYYWSTSHILHNIPNIHSILSHNNLVMLFQTQSDKTHKISSIFSPNFDILSNHPCICSEEVVVVHKFLCILFHARMGSELLQMGNDLNLRYMLMVQWCSTLSLWWHTDIVQDIEEYILVIILVLNWTVSIKLICHHF